MTLICFLGCKLTWDHVFQTTNRDPRGWHWEGCCPGDSGPRGRRGPVSQACWLQAGRGAQVSGAGEAVQPWWSFHSHPSTVCTCFWLLPGVTSTCQRTQNARLRQSQCVTGRSILHPDGRGSWSMGVLGSPFVPLPCLRAPEVWGFRVSLNGGVGASYTSKLSFLPGMLKHSCFCASSPLL